MGEDIVRRVVLDQLAVAEDRDAARHLHGLVDVVADEDDGLLKLRLELHELVLDHLAVDRVDRAEGLVHQQHRRVGGERAHHADALLLAAGELLGIALQEDRRVEIDHVEQLGSALARLRRRPAEQVRHDADVLLDRHVGEQADLLDDVADRTPQRDLVDTSGILAVDIDPARGRRDQPVDHLHRGGLAAARGAEQDADGAGRHLHVDAVDGDHRPEMLGNLLETDHFSFNPGEVSRRCAKSRP